MIPSENDRDIFGLPNDRKEQYEPYGKGWHPLKKLTIAVLLVCLCMVGAVGGYPVMTCFGPEDWGWWNQKVGEQEFLVKTDLNQYSYDYRRYVFVENGVCASAVKPELECLSDDMVTNHGYIDGYWYNTLSKLKPSTGKWLRVE